MRAYFIDTISDRTGIADVKHELEEFYKFCDCRCIDIAVREIDGHPFNIAIL